MLILLFFVKKFELLTLLFCDGNLAATCAMVEVNHFFLLVNTWLNMHRSFVSLTTWFPMVLFTSEILPCRKCMHINLSMVFSERSKKWVLSRIITYSRSAKVFLKLSWKALISKVGVSTTVLFLPLLSKLRHEENIALNVKVLLHNNKH